MAIKVFMPSWVVKNILSRENTFADYEFIVESWEDNFIVELLRWYDNKVSKIEYNKRNWHTCSDESRWRQYYEQMFRMLYYAVIMLKLRGPKSLKNLFRYFFEVEDEDTYRRHPDLISAEKLLMVYNYIIKIIGKISYKKDRGNLPDFYPFIGHWDTEQMQDLYEHRCSSPITGLGIEPDECDSHYKEERQRNRDVTTFNEEMERDIKFLQEILDRMKQRLTDDRSRRERF